MNSTNNNVSSINPYRTDHILPMPHAATEAPSQLNTSTKTAENSTEPSIIIKIESTRTETEPINTKRTEATSTQSNRILNKLKSLFKF